MVMTLLDAAAAAGESPKQTIILSLVERMWTLGEKLSWQPASLVGAQYGRISDIDTLSWRQIGQPSVAKQVRVDQFREGLRMIREHIDIDNAIRTDPLLGPPQVRLQIEGTTQKIAYGVNDSSINGTPVSNPDELIGCDFRLTNDPIFHGGLITGNDRGQVIDAAGLDVDGSSANSQLWLDYVHSMFSRCDGVLDALLMNLQTKDKFAGILRRERQGLVDTTKDLFDRRITAFNGTPLVDMGVKPAGAVAKQVAQQVFPHNTKTSPFAATANTSWMLGVRIDAQHFTGLQRDAMVVNTGIGQLPNDPATFRIAFIEWILATALLQRNAAAAVYGLVI